MKKIITWFLLSCKRYLKKMSFLIILLALPAGVLGAGQAQKRGNQDINIAIWVEEKEENELGVKLADRLVNRERGADGGMFRFYLCGSEDEVRNETASRRAECGYVIYAGLKGKLDAGTYKRSIGVYSAPSTVAAALSTETVFGALMELYDRELLTSYVAEDELFESLGEAGSQSRSEAAKKAGELYGTWLDNGSTFRFEYEFLGRAETKGGPSEAGAPDIFPVRGLAAVYVFITGLYGAVVVCGDEKRGMFLPLSYGLRTPCRLAAMAAPAVMASISGLLALWAGGSFTSLPVEIVVMGGYCASVVAVSWIIRTVCRSPQAICCLIPFLVIGSLVFCPVFVDAGRFVQGLDTVGRLFPPWYYLQFFR